jgi:hypothetical protein
MRNKQAAFAVLLILQTLLLMAMNPVRLLAAQGERITLAGPGLTVVFDHTGNRLALVQIQRQADPPLLYSDQLTRQAGPGPVGNPLAVVVQEGKYKGVYGMNTFRVTKLNHDERRLLAYLEHDTLPLLVAIEVSVEGNVCTWSGQVLWNGNEGLEAEIYFPLLSRVRFDSPPKDRILTAQTSGSVLENLSTLNYSNSYMGTLSCPVFLAEGGGRGLAVVDDNHSDLAADPSASSLRSQVFGNRFPLVLQARGNRTFRTSGAWLPVGGDDGPFLGIRHTRVFNPISVYGGEAAYASQGDGSGASGSSGEQVPLRKLGDSVDLGPIRMYAYAGTWRTGAAWLRTQRAHVPFRISPAAWYRNTTFVSEEMGDILLSKGQSFYDLPKVLAERQQMGSDFFHFYGFHDPEILGTQENWNNRGDYFFAARNLGDFEGARQGIEAVHRAGGHIIYYVEGLIMWKRSRIGRTYGKEWALMNADGTYTEHYQGFWHMCPADKEWQDWIAHTCAEIVKTTGVDGFFIDSLTATYNHRCFNPAHHHPHPDVWNWGVRQMLRRIREEVDKVNPETILIVEGEGDMAREYADGFLAHGHAWTSMTLTEPLVRFLHPQMRAFESWGTNEPRPDGRPAPPTQKLHVWNSVNGFRIYAHNSNRIEMASLGLRTRKYYNAFPEICDNPMSDLEVKCQNCIAQLFEGLYPVLTLGNVTDKQANAVIDIPVPAGMLFDRVDSTRVPVSAGKARVVLSPWEYRAFEVRP